MNILEVQNVYKTFDKNVAVNGVSIEVPQQSIFGLLGPNGAGKTTLIRMITSILAPDSGTILLEGVDDPQQRMLRIGYMPEERGLYKKMKVGEQIMYLAQLKNMSKKAAREQLKYWFEKFEIADWYGKKVEELSKGMQQKIQFISTVIHQPSVIILDEPFSGLDPVNSNLIQREIYELRQKGATIIFSTHRMEQVEQICENIAMIHKGNKILDGPLNDIKNQFKEHIFKIEYNGELPDLQGRFSIYEQEENAVIIQLQDEQSSNELLAFFVQNGGEVESFNEILPTINEIFINQVGGTSDE